MLLTLPAGLCSMSRLSELFWGAGSSGVGCWTLDPKVQGSNPWGTGRWGLAASPSPWLWRWAAPPASGPHTYRKNSQPGQCKWNICSALIHTKTKQNYLSFTCLTNVYLHMDAFFSKPNISFFNKVNVLSTWPATSTLLKNKIWGLEKVSICALSFHQPKMCSFYT